MARIKKETGPILKSVEELEKCVSAIADLTTQKMRIEAAMNAELQAIRDMYQRDLVEVSDDIEAEVKLAKDWAQHNPQAFADKKSVDCLNGTIGYRTGMPAVRFLKGWTEERVIEALQLSAEGAKYIRMVPAIDKVAVIKDQDHVAEFGMKVTQTESFFVNPKIETKEA